MRAEVIRGYVRWGCQFLFAMFSLLDGEEKLIGRGIA